VKTMWKNEWSAVAIKLVTVEKETDKCVYIRAPNGRLDRFFKTTEDVAIRDTWEEVRQFLLDVQQKKIGELNRRIKYHQDRYGNIKGMKKPKGVE